MGDIGQHTGKHIRSSASTRLPTSFGEPGGDNNHIAIAIISHLDLQHVLNEHRNCTEELMTVAWALLLRVYVLSDQVSFYKLNEEEAKQCAGYSNGTTVNCTWQSRLKSARSTWEELLPSISTSTESNLPRFENQINTLLVRASLGTTVHSSCDYKLLYELSEQRTVAIELQIRRSAVPVLFGNAIAERFGRIILALAENDLARLTEALSHISDLDRIHDFIQRPLVEQQDCLHKLVQRKVIEMPDSEAVCAWDGKLTYRDLDIFSDRIARTLVNSGVHCGQYVPFAFEKSMWSVVAVLAILKSGAAFVPVDPDQHDSVIKQTLTDVGATVLLSSDRLRARFETLVNETIVVSATTVNTPSTPDLAQTTLPEVSPDDVAFVLFTSGSTGKPKGMVLQHGAYSTHTICHGKFMKYEKLRVLQFAAHTFDVFVMDIFATLAFGGCICIPSDEDRRFHIVDVLRNFQIDLVILTPSFAHLLEPKLVTGLKVLAVGGEALKKETISKWMSDAPGTDLIQIYGPAEVGICILGNLDPSCRRPEWLGYPLENSACFLIDPEDDDDLVPMGAVGELVVAGPTMLREYLNNPEKTRASFLDNPRWARNLELPSRRFYRSGDLLRYNIERMDGSFDFIGRKDSQVKYHGQRMELEGIEHHLSSIPVVAACMVALPKQGVMNDRLVAIVQEKSSNEANFNRNRSISVVIDASLTLDQIQVHLSDRLPKYMIPNALLVVRDMPFTASLKLDRPRINRWIANLQSQVIANEFVRKLDYDVLAATETIAHTISNEYARLVAGKDTICRLDFEGRDFCLQAGGIDSIQIISLSNFIEKKWHVRIPMSTILSSSTTVRDVAARVIGGTAEAQSRASSLSDFSMATEVQMLVEQIVANVHEAADPKICHEAETENVLLTGAAGFLGIEILHFLLAKGLKVCVLIRAADHAVARKRLICEARRIGWWKEIYGSRLAIWLGDLSSPFLGLEKSHQDQLTGSCPSGERIHVVIHNGAKVHYGLDYHTLKKANVCSTVELLKLVRTASPPLKALVYISGGQQLNFDDDPSRSTSIEVAVEHGYTRSKLVSESLMKECMKRSDFSRTQLRVVKPGYIIGGAQDGTPNKTDFLWRLIASCVEVGAYNEGDADRWVFVASRERVATAIVDSVFDSVPHSVMQMTDGMRFIDIWQMIQKEFGFDMIPLPRLQWLSKIERAVEVEQHLHVMFPLLHLLREGEPIGSLGGPCIASSGVQEAMRANLKVLIRDGYLKHICQVGQT